MSRSFQGPLIESQHRIVQQRKAYLELLDSNGSLCTKSGDIYTLF